MEIASLLDKLYVEVFRDCQRLNEFELMDLAVEESSDDEDWDDVSRG